MHYAENYAVGSEGEAQADPMEELRRIYLEAAKQDVADLSSEIEKALADHAAWPDACAELRRIVHNVKGQGSSFGYPLMTDIGGSLSQLLKAIQEPSEPLLKLVAAHVQGLRLVMDQDIQGDGGEQGQQLVKRLSQLLEAHTNAVG